MAKFIKKMSNNITAKKNVEQVVKDIKQPPRKLFSAEEKIGIVIEEIRCKEAVASICPKYDVTKSFY